MAARLKVRIDPPSNRPNVLKVQDALAQVLDLFDLTGYTEVESSENVIWRIVAASNNSPFIVIAEAVSLDPGVDIQETAHAQRREFIRNMQSLIDGEVPEIWGSGAAQKIVAKLAERNRNGIGATNIASDSDENETLEREAAYIAVTKTEATYILEQFGEEFAIEPIPAKTQIGSIEGVLLGATTYYHKPAIRVKERKTRMAIPCVIPDDRRDHIAAETNFEDVWKGQRVVVSGRIEYSNSGSISRVIANEIRKISPKPVQIEDIQDKEFTDGLAPAEYLDKFREGDIG